MKKFQLIISELTFWYRQTSILDWALCYCYPLSALFFGQTISSVSCCSLVPSEVNRPCSLPDHLPSVSPLFSQKWTLNIVQAKLKDLIFITCHPDKISFANKGNPLLCWKRDGQQLCQLGVSYAARTGNGNTQPQSSSVSHFFNKITQTISWCFPNCLSLKIFSSPIGLKN